MGLGRQCSHVLACGSFLLLGYNVWGMFLVLPQTRAEVNSGQARIGAFRSRLPGTKDHKSTMLYTLHIVVVFAALF